MRAKALRVYDAIFSNQPSIVIDGTTYFMDRTPRSKLRLFNIEGYTFLEQNPRKSSHWAKLAREGRRIMWVMSGRRYLGQVRDGEFHDFRTQRAK
jgi:hypothetical protein